MENISASDRARLIACLRLWERPGTPGERDAAFAGALRILRTNDLTWDDVVAGDPSTQPPDWRVLCAQCLRGARDMTDWEIEFVTSLLGFPRISEKQCAVLRSIAQRLDGRRAE